VTPYSPLADQTLQGMANLGLAPDQALGLVERQVNSQAYMLSATDFFWISAMLFILLIGVVWFAKPVKGAAGPQDSGGAH
jgi:DHA2 family multidrug resistance protein